MWFLATLLACSGAVGDPAICTDPGSLDFADGRPVASFNGSIALAAGDLDGDGVDDAVWEELDDFEGRFELVTSLGDRWTIPGPFGGASRSDADHPLLLADVDQDGRNEVVYAGWMHGGDEEVGCPGDLETIVAAHVFTSRGEEQGLWTYARDALGCKGEVQVELGAGPLGELLLSHVNHGAWAVEGVLGDLDGEALMQVSSPVFESTIGDLDGDGRPEAVLIGDVEYAIADLDAGGVEMQNSLGTLWDNPSGLHSGQDLTGNGTDEVVWVGRVEDGEPWALRLLDIDGELVASMSDVRLARAVADLDGDGLGELAVARLLEDGYEVGVLRSPVGPEPTWDDAWIRFEVPQVGVHDMTSADLDGDGARELLVGDFFEWRAFEVCPAPR